MKDKIRTTCPYCGVGCGVEITKSGGNGFYVKGDNLHPANFGKLCTKGRALNETLSTETRLGSPLINGKKVNWQDATDLVAEKFRKLIKNHGADSIGFYVSGQLLTEDYYVANKLMKGFIGSGNIDTNSRLCMSSPVIAQQRAYGSDTVPVNYSDLEKANLIVLAGSNLSWCHPVLFQRIKAEKARRKDLKIMVIDPRLTASAEIADLVLNIQSGTDLLLFNTLFTFLLDQQSNSNAANRLNGYKEACIQARLDIENLGEVSNRLEISLEELRTFIESFANTEKVVTVFSQGINQSTRGVDTCSAIINCHLVSGKIGKEGMGPLPITGQPNAMGGREVGAMASTLAAHLGFGQKESELLSRFWKTDRVATQPGLKAVELFKAVESGRVKAIWIMATNPIVSMPSSDKIKRALEKCELVVVSEAFNNSETLEFADVIFPAQPWGEKSGTVTNSERRISRQRSFLSPYKQSLPDWEIIARVAKAMGYEEGFNFENEYQVFKEHAALSRKAFELTGSFNLAPLSNLSFSQYQNLPPTQWPQVDPDSIDLAEVRPFVQNTAKDGIKRDISFHTQNQLANLIPVKFHAGDNRESSSEIKTLKNSKQNQIESTRASSSNKLETWRLNTGRVRDQWHTMTRTSLARRLNQHTQEPLLSINPEDAKRKQWKDKSLVKLYGNSRSAIVRLSYSKHVQRGSVFFPMHWGAGWNQNGSINRLVESKRDRASGQPAFKQGRVQIEKTNISTHILIASKYQLKLTGFSYKVKSLINGGFLYILASAKSVDDCVEEVTKVIKSLNIQHVLDKERSSLSILDGSDRTDKVRRVSFLNKNIPVVAFEVSESFKRLSTSWFSNVLGELEEESISASLISGRPKGELIKGKDICLCSRIGENQLKLSKECGTQNNELNKSIENLCRSTGMGNGCGSCVGDVLLKLTE